MGTRDAVTGDENKDGAVDEDENRIEDENRNEGAVMNGVEK